MSRLDAMLAWDESTYYWPENEDVVLRLDGREYSASREEIRAAREEAGLGAGEVIQDLYFQPGPPAVRSRIWRGTVEGVRTELIIPEPSDDAVRAAYERAKEKPALPAWTACRLSDEPYEEVRKLIDAMEAKRHAVEGTGPTPQLMEVTQSDGKVGLQCAYCGKGWSFEAFRRGKALIRDCARVRGGVSPATT